MKNLNRDLDADGRVININAVLSKARTESNKNGETVKQTKKMHKNRCSLLKQNK
jgi:uncharacterized protein YuzE